MSDEKTVCIPIEVPADDAELMQQFAKELVEEARVRTNRKKRDAELRLIERKQYKDRKEAFLALAPEAYRLYKLHRPAHQSAKDIYSLIATQLFLEKPIAAELLVQKHRSFVRKERPKEALKLIRKGLTIKAIAERLDISTRTVNRLLKAARDNTTGGHNA